MKKKYLITGIAGSGKSTVCKELNAQGHESYDIEDIDGMFAMYRKDTGELYTDYENADPAKIKNAEWRCDANKLSDFLKGQEADRAFYCGVASNMDDILSLFDKVFLLKTDKEKLHARLSNREGTEDIGNSEEGRQAVLGWKDWWEGEMGSKGVDVVSADRSPEEVARSIISLS